MRDMFNAFFSAFTSLFKGVDQYAQTFEASGRMANKAMQTYEAEVEADLQQKRANLNLLDKPAELPLKDAAA